MQIYFLFTDLEILLIKTFPEYQQKSKYFSKVETEQLNKEYYKMAENEGEFLPNQILKLLKASITQKQQVKFKSLKNLKMSFCCLLVCL